VAECNFDFPVQKAVQASPKNRFSWHVWALFEANQGNTDKARKLFKIGHAVNPRDPVILQSLALLEYNCASPNMARVLFRKASQIDPRHQPVWIVRISALTFVANFIILVRCGLFSFIYRWCAFLVLDFFLYGDTILSVSNIDLM
jgi:Tfp pilus assembly protein PilF